MPLVIARDRDAPAPPGAGGLEIGLVNNMPDKALEATERQFTALLEAAAGDIPVRLWLYAMPLVPRSERGVRHLGESYLDLRDLWDSRLDALIVTGTEPRASALAEEPYWPALAELIEWAERHTISTAWSCLAAHAAVYQLDGIGRHPLAAKRFGVFDCATTLAHPLTEGLAPHFAVPHSRWNELAEPELAAAGYHVLTRSTEAGVDMFARDGASLFIFFQGHPEYEAASLLGEYRRDFGRYLRGERETAPALPNGYFDALTAARLAKLQGAPRRTGGRNCSPNFPTRWPNAGLRNGWHGAATQIYRNWLAYLSAQKVLRPERRAGAGVRRLHRIRTRRAGSIRPAALSSIGAAAQIRAAPTRAGATAALRPARSFRPCRA